MEMRTWVTAWGTYAAVPEELQRLFASPAAQALVQQFEKKGLDPEILAFAFIVFIVPGRRRRAALRADD